MCEFWTDAVVHNLGFQFEEPEMTKLWWLECYRSEILNQITKNVLFGSIFLKLLFENVKKFAFSNRGQGVHFKKYI